MAYKPNPMNASGVNEQQFQDLYTQNKAAIDAYVQAHPNGKDPREAAFEAVTGQPWPNGRGVNSSGQMTKDRTVKSVLGKYVAPIAAGALTAGFGVPALLGGGAAAGASGAGATGIGATTGGAGTGLLASSGIPLAYSAGATVPSAAVGSTLAGAGGAGLMSTIAKKAGGSAVERIAGAAGAGINQATQDAAANRGTKLTYEQEQERLRQKAQDDFQRQLIAREVENRAATKDAMDRLQSASYNAQRKPYAPPTITSNVAGVKPQTVTNFGIGRTNAPSADEMAAYKAQIDQSRDRLMSGPQLPQLEDPTKRPFYTQPNPNLNPGTMERIGQIAGPGLSIWDRIGKYL